MNTDTPDTPTVISAPNPELDPLPGSNAAAPDSESSRLGDVTDPELRDLLEIERENRGASNGRVTFKTAGRDFHWPQFEVALLSAMLNHPTVVELVLAELSTEDFFMADHHVMVKAIAEIHGQGIAVSGSTLTAFLKEAAEDDGAAWDGYVKSCADVSSNPKHVRFYIEKLKQASEVRGGKDYAVHGFSESFCAGLLRHRLPPTKCVNGDWYQYRDGEWSVEDKNIIRKEALSVIHPWHRQSRRAVEVMNHVEHALQVRASDFVGPYKLVNDQTVLIAVANGVLSVSPDSGVALVPHSPSYGFTAKLAAPFEEAARAPVFERTLENALPDPEDRLLFQAMAGYVLLPDCRHETAFVAYGPGATGKSTLTGVVLDVIGPRLCGATGLEELCKSSSYSLAALKGKILNRAAELRGTEIEASANFKALVSGEALTVRPIYGKPEEMRTACKLWFLSNHGVRFQNGSDAEARRLRILPFKVKPKSPDPLLKSKLTVEFSGVLNWMLEGLVWVLRNGRIPQGGEGARAAMAQFERSNDPVGMFVRQCCDFGPSYRVVKTDLFDAFVTWAEDAGLCPDKWENFFFKSLRERNTEIQDVRPTIDGKRVRCLAGVRLNDLFPPREPGVLTHADKKNLSEKLHAAHLRN